MDLYNNNKRHDNQIPVTQILLRKKDCPRASSACPTTSDCTLSRVHCPCLQYIYTNYRDTEYSCDIIDPIQYSVLSIEKNSRALRFSSEAQARSAQLSSLQLSFPLLAFLRQQLLLPLLNFFFTSKLPFPTDPDENEKEQLCRGEQSPFQSHTPALSLQP